MYKHVLRIAAKNEGLRGREFEGPRHLRMRIRALLVCVFGPLRPY
jgi:hypothetical protein